MTQDSIALALAIENGEISDQRIAELQRANEYRLRKELETLPKDETMDNELCPWHLSAYLAVGAIPLFTVGLILTGISVYVYTRPYQLKTTVGYLLAFLSIFEWLFLLTSFESLSLAQIPTLSCPAFKNGPTYFKSYSMALIYPLTHVSKYMCVCISIMISIQQWIAVFLPMEVRNLCDMKKTKRLLIFSALFSIFLSIPRFMEEKIRYGKLSEDNSWKNIFILDWINSFDDHIFNAFTVFSALLIINVSIIALLKWSEHERMRITSQSYKDRRTSMMLLAVLCAYVITHLPSMLIGYKVFDYLKEVLPQDIEGNKREISNFAMCCHPLFSFADYLIFSEKYRNSVKSIFYNPRRSASSNNAVQAV